MMRNFGQGRENVKRMMDEDPKFMEEVEQKVRTRMQEEKVGKKEEIDKKENTEKKEKK